MRHCRSYIFASGRSDNRYCENASFVATVVAMAAQPHAHDVSMYNYSSSGSCNIDAPGTTYVGSNIYPTSAPNTTDTSAGCCALCQSTKACEFWTWTPTCPKSSTARQVPLNPPSRANPNPTHEERPCPGRGYRRARSGVAWSVSRRANTSAHISAADGYRSSGS